METLGIIESFRRGPKTQRNNQMIVLLPYISTTEIDNLVGAMVHYQDKYGNTYEGYVKKRHGNGKKVLVEFKRPLPGHSLGDIVKIKKSETSEINT